MKELDVFENWPFKVPNVEKVKAQEKEMIEALKNAKDEVEALKIVKKFFKEGNKVDNEFTHISVLYSIDTRVKKYEKAMDLLNEQLPELQALSVEFKKAVIESKYRPYLEKKLGSFLFKMYDYSLRSFNDSIIEDSVEENKLTMEYSKTIASAKIEFRGNTYNLPQMGKFMQDLDRNTRIEASKAYYGYLETIKDKLEDIYDKLVKVRDRMAKKLGYKNYVELAYINMSRYDYNETDVKGYRKQINEVVTPLVEKLVKAQLKRINVKDPHIYDLNLSFADGNPIPLGTTEDKIKNAQKMYDEMSKETSEFFKFMDEHHLLQLEAKEGKQSGGYMTYFPVYQTPIIFSNFNGTSGDVDVLTHEFGHAFQGHLAKDIKIPEYHMPTMESCECHSMSMEFFAHPYMGYFFDNPEKYKYQHLADSISFLPYGVTVDHFQEWVYENPEATKAERDAKWHELEELYTPYKVRYYKDNNYLMEGHRWLLQSHIFTSPFYYIDYTLAQVIAFQFFNLDRKNHELAWKRYISLCKNGGKYPFRDLIKKAHLKDPFVDGTIKATITPLIKELKNYKID